MGARAAGGERGRGARARTCTQYCAGSTSLALYLCVSLKCGVVQCVPLNLVDVKVFWHRLGCARGRVDERTNEFAASGSLFYPEKQALATKAETRQPCPRRSNNVVPAHYTQCTAGTTRHGPSSSITVRRATVRPASVPRRHQSTPRRRAPQRLSQRTQHRGVLGSHPGGPRPDCGAAVCTHGANRARQQSARAPRCECRDCEDGQRHVMQLYGGERENAESSTRGSGCTMSVVR